ncbi:hypothetical protein ZYGR_0AY00270 [Zygosaccharomyces rouxii]|uniref:ORC6 first cyclin-like domain-containing protein n=1 Tax=Zygosaccharomyces rouxii TaxID=4956 RepID=A0A1Q3AIZ6_ZYGRO|nr:hypothetical protein ZYGR_0AY00270 [Zygosaccharomyces rouxii]
MSSHQIQRCIRDILGIHQEEELDWCQGHFKKLLSATSTLHTASLNKVMLKQDEETARLHLCAFIACERLAEKHMPELSYYMDRVPLEPRKGRKLMELIKQNVFQSSPVKNFQWTPSPKKRNNTSPLKNGDRFTAQDPQILRKQLFDTPTKGGSPVGDPVKNTQVMNSPSSNASPSKARRKLAFEDEDEIENPVPANNQSLDTLAQLSMVANERLNNEEEELRKKPRGSNKRSPQQHEQQPAPKKRRETGRSRSDMCLLQKRYYKVTPAEIINLCNQFEIPKDVAYSILDQFMSYASYLVCPWKLACGLVLNATFVVFTERRRKDPRVDHLILEKMCGITKASQLEDITECINLVKELIEGEKWYRDLQIKHNYYNGACFDEAISTKLGSMLQPNNILVSNEQFASWRRKIEQDLSLKDMH